MIEQVLEAWRVNQRVNLRLIERISDEGMRCTLSVRGGRNVVRQLAYLVAHESHHRGSILLTLEQCGHPLDSKTRYGIKARERI